ncbi:hypothetical protein OOU_Y34scaffold00158g4 [Pyricularia oryzae Y34]|uniref:Uncharacterized protein n=2 Tax=Pyricularia oryzae TaxID=318829 RepID=A0AA97P7C0_PYRO3|nr:hypothetical protein OOU_Y34scaffold00158g4 [Pyricularia oryzae Y34]
MATCLLGGTKTTPSKTLEEQCMSWRINISTSPRQPQKKLEIPLAGSRWMWLGLPSRLHPLCLSRAFHPYVREQDRKKGGPTARGRRDRTSIPLNSAVGYENPKSLDRPITRFDLNQKHNSEQADPDYRPQSRPLLASKSLPIWICATGSAKCLMQFWPSNGVRLVRRRHTKEGLNLPCGT